MNTPKQSILLIGAMAMLVAFGAAAVALAVPQELGLSGMPPLKSAVRATSPIPPVRVLVGGDDAAHATVIPSLPYTDSGNTCAFNSDYVFNCPGDYNGSPAQDVVYKFTPTSNLCVNISICESGYDTGLYVWRNTVGNMIACNDDVCGPTAQQSRIAGLQLTAGNTYYIVVDAYAGCGTYNLSVSQCLPSCTPLACPPGAISEGEPVCGTGYVDDFNGGCNSNPHVYQNISLPTTICGQYGWYGVTRDTDWYQFQLTEPKTMHICVEGEIPTVLEIIKATGCDSVVRGSFGSPLQCQTFCENRRLDPGTYWIFLAPQWDTSFPPCGSRYVLSVSGSTPSGIGEGELPLAFNLEQNAPNPTRGGKTTIGFALPRAASVELAIYTLAGSRVRTLVSGPQSAGQKTIVWDGRDDSGKRVGSGVYFYKLVAGSFGTARKIVLLK